MDVHDRGLVRRARGRPRARHSGHRGRPSAKEVELVDGAGSATTSCCSPPARRPRTLPLPGAGAHGVLTLRRIEDSDAISAAFGDGGRLRRRSAAAGSGWRRRPTPATQGVDVTVLEAADLPLSAVSRAGARAGLRSTCTASTAWTFQLGAGVEEITVTDGRATGVRLADGTHVPADTVLVGVGARPNLELAESAGLEIGTGVLVDASPAHQRPRHLGGRRHRRGGPPVPR